MLHIIGGQVFGPEDTAGLLLAFALTALPTIVLLVSLIWLVRDIIKKRTSRISIVLLCVAITLFIVQRLTSSFF